jgi:hypothetical protein
MLIAKAFRDAGNARRSTHTIPKEDTVNCGRIHRMKFVPADDVLADLEKKAEEYETAAKNMP